MDKNKSCARRQKNAIYQVIPGIRLIDVSQAQGLDQKPPSLASPLPLGSLGAL